MLLVARQHLIVSFLGKLQLNLSGLQGASAIIRHDADQGRNRKESCTDTKIVLGSEHADNDAAESGHRL